MQNLVDTLHKNDQNSRDVKYTLGSQEKTAESVEWGG